MIQLLSHEMTHQNNYLKINKNTCVEGESYSTQYMFHFSIQLLFPTFLAALNILRFILQKHR
jgi:hypothetical protein